MSSSRNLEAIERITKDEIKLLRIPEMAIQNNSALREDVKDQINEIHSQLLFEREIDYEQFTMAFYFNVEEAVALASTQSLSVLKFWRYALDKEATDDYHDDFLTRQILFRFCDAFLVCYSEHYRQILVPEIGLMYAVIARVSETGHKISQTAAAGMLDAQSLTVDSAIRDYKDMTKDAKKRKKRKKKHQKE